MFKQAAYDGFIATATALVDWILPVTVIIITVRLLTNILFDRR